MTLTARQQVNAIRTAAIGGLLILTAALVASFTPRDDGAAKYVYILFMVGADLVLAAAFAATTKMYCRIIAASLGVIITLGPFVAFMIDQITA